MEAHRPSYAIQGTGLDVSTLVISERLDDLARAPCL